MFQSLYSSTPCVCGARLAWVATIFMFWYVTSLNIRNGFLPAPRGSDFFGEFTFALPVLHVGIIGMLILTRWWEFWTS